MASTESLVLAAWQTQLSLPTVAGGYLHDWTATGDVRLGSPTQTAARECVFIDDPAFRVEVFALGQIRTFVEVVIVGFAGATGNVPGTQMRACADMWSTIKRVVYADRTLGGVVLNADVTGGLLKDEKGNYYVGAAGTCFFDSAAGAP